MGVLFRAALAASDVMAELTTEARPRPAARAACFSQKVDHCGASFGSRSGTAAGAVESLKDWLVTLNRTAAAVIYDRVQVEEVIVLVGARACVVSTQRRLCASARSCLRCILTEDVSAYRTIRPNNCFPSYWVPRHCSQAVIVYLQYPIHYLND